MQITINPIAPSPHPICSAVAADTSGAFAAVVASFERPTPLATTSAGSAQGEEQSAEGSAAPLNQDNANQTKDRSTNVFSAEDQAQDGASHAEMLPHLDSAALPDASPVLPIVEASGTDVAPVYSAPDPSAVMPDTILLADDLPVQGASARQAGPVVISAEPATEAGSFSPSKPPSAKGKGIAFPAEFTSISTPATLKQATAPEQGARPQGAMPSLAPGNAMAFVALQVIPIPSASPAFPAAPPPESQEEVTLLAPLSGARSHFSHRTMSHHLQVTAHNPAHFQASSRLGGASPDLQNVVLSLATPLPAAPQKSGRAEAGQYPAAATSVAQADLPLPWAIQLELLPTKTPVLTSLHPVPHAAPIGHQTSAAPAQARPVLSAVATARESSLTAQPLTETIVAEIQALPLTTPLLDASTARVLSQAAILHNRLPTSASGLLTLAVIAVPSNHVPAENSPVYNSSPPFPVRMIDRPAANQALPNLIVPEDTPPTGPSAAFMGRAEYPVRLQDPIPVELAKATQPKGVVPSAEDVLPGSSRPLILGMTTAHSKDQVPEYSALPRDIASPIQHPSSSSCGSPSPSFSLGFAQQSAHAILQAASVGIDGSIELSLRPDELGQLRFDISTSGDKLAVVVFIERPEAMDLFRRHGEQLLNELRLAGFAQPSLSFGDWSQRNARAAVPLARSNEDPSGKVTADADSPLPASQKTVALGRLDLRL